MCNFSKQFGKVRMPLRENEQETVGVKVIAFYLKSGSTKILEKCIHIMTTGGYLK